jgi:hypothetical protein
LSLSAGGFVERSGDVRSIGRVGRPLASAQLVGSRRGAGDDCPSEVMLAAVAPSLRAEKEWLPEWVRDHVARDSPPEAVLRDALRRVLGTPDRSTLLEAELLLRELGRNAEHAELIRSVVAEAAGALFVKVES